MSALYRKARPATFDEMVGQEHVKEVLDNALKSGRLAQAYLFSGPRGVGKTSAARLIAQAVNCTSSEKPCGVCQGCMLVREGKHLDVVEIDAASNNSVEDVRDLREKIALSPVLSERKVIILDEAHMLSKSAFNALLKTLEEPPPHVIFIFATTEPERMPPTILSRTQHFRFRRLSETEIIQKLSRILEGMGQEAEPEALKLIARLADGAMRDAESLLDRLLSLEGKITLAGTEASLGLPPQQVLFSLAEALDQGQVKEAVGLAEKLYTQGFAARTLAQGLLEALRAGLYARMGLASGPELGASEERIVAAMAALDQALERLVRRSDLLSLEVALLSAFQALGAAEPSAAKPGIPDAPKKSAPEPKPATPNLPHQEPAVLQNEVAESAPAADDSAQSWRQVLAKLKQSQRAFFREARPYFEERGLVLVFPEKASFHYQSAVKNQDAIREAVREVLGGLEVYLELAGAKKKLAGDQNAETPKSSFAWANSAPAGKQAGPDAAPAGSMEPPHLVSGAEERDLVMEESEGLETASPHGLSEAQASEPLDTKVSIVEDPKFQDLARLFGARVKKVWQEKRLDEPEAGISDDPEE
ncbi:MAG: DNA polymerase III subunit gamma/tau [Deinococcus sp.]|nr:DNA polymerase III subunit gamma/tau [Deinococcus sp.]